MSKNFPEMFDLDVILAELGYFGPFQLKNFILFCIPMIFSAFFTLSYVFTAGTVEHRCAIPECDSIDVKNWSSFAIPRKIDERPELCSQFMLINVVNGTHLAPSCAPESFNRSAVVECNDVVFDTDEITISNEWKITCESNKWKLTLVGTVNNVGHSLCIPFSGIVSDRYGRKTALIIGMLTGSLFGILRAFSQNYLTFISLEFLSTLFSSGVATVSFVMCMEFLPMRHRKLGGVTFSIFFPIGAIIIAGLAFYFQNWRYLLLSLNIPAAFTIFYIWMISESLRWLQSKGKYEEISETVQMAAKMNKVTLSQKTLNMMTPSTATPTEIEQESLLSIFKYKKMLFIVVNCSFCMFTNYLVYVGLTLYSVTLAGSKYLNFTYTNLMELPAHVVAYFLITKAGRRYSMASTMVIAGLACFGRECFAIGAVHWRFAFYMLGKLAISTSFTIFYLYSLEMFPTSIRNTLIGICTMFGRLGAILAPQAPLLATKHPSLPLFIFGAFSIISGTLVLALPETANKQLPDSIAEVLNLGVDKSAKA